MNNNNLILFIFSLLTSINILVLPPRYITTIQYIFLLYLYSFSGVAMIDIVIYIKSRRSLLGPPPFYIYSFFSFSSTINLSKIQSTAGKITKVLIRAKEILITVINPKSFKIRNFESISTLNPPTVVSPEATVALPIFFIVVDIAS